MVEVHIIRDREMIQYKYMEEEDYFTQTLLPALIDALAAAAMAAGLLPLQLSLSFYSLTHTHRSLSLSFCSQIMPLFIGISWQTIGHQLWHKWWQHMGCTIFIDGGCNYHCSFLTMITLLLRVGCIIYCPLMANPNTFNGCVKMLDQIPHSSISS